MVMGRLISLKAAADREGNHDGDEELSGAIENLGGDDRFSFSLDWLENQTALHRESVVSAKRQLYKLGIVQWSGGKRRGWRHANRLACPELGFSRCRCTGIDWALLRQFR